jgi:uridine kinase
MGLVIGLHGSKGSGKDQFFTVLRKNFPQLDVQKIAYADPIKTEVMNIFGLQSEDQYDLFKRTQLQFCLHSGQNTPDCVSGRQVVREIGMLMRRYNSDQFIQYVNHCITASPNALWCVTDLRFDNELQSLQMLDNSIIVKVKRPGYNFDGHVTETELPDSECSSIINNDGTLEQYEEKILDTMRSIFNTLRLN